MIWVRHLKPNLEREDRILFVQSTDIRHSFSDQKLVLSKPVAIRLVLANMHSINLQEIAITEAGLRDIHG